MSTTENDPFTRVVELAPRRDLPESERERLGVPRCGRGRPRVIRPKPDLDDPYLTQLHDLRVEAEAGDPILAACRDHDEKTERVVEHSLMGIAREAAALRFEREAAEKRGADVSQLCSRRISALSTLASLIVERARVGGERDLDVRDPRLLRIVDLFHEQIREVAIEVMDDERAKVFLTAYRAKTVGWQDRIDPPRAPPEK